MRLTINVPYLTKLLQTYRTRECGQLFSTILQTVNRDVECHLTSYNNRLYYVTYHVWVITSPYPHDDVFSYPARWEFQY